MMNSIYSDLKPMITVSDIENAYDNIKGGIKKTPLVFSMELSKISGANVYLKMEHLQHTGSFKIRGVLNKIYSINKKDFNKPFVAASTGNHAAAFAYASEKFDFKGVLFLPKGVSKIKLKAIENFDVEKILFGDSGIETESKATDYAKGVNGVLIHPYNDIKIIEGQGTIGVEIKEQLPELDAVLAPVGGGGLISGLCSYFKDSKDVEVIGCQPENACEMYDSIKLNAIVPPSKLHTVADASAGGVEDNSVTFDICKKHLSRFELIDEDAIKKAVAFIARYHLTIIEPTAALPVAALLNSNKYQGKNVVLVLTGNKINESLLTQILTSYGDNH